MMEWIEQKADQPPRDPRNDMDALVAPEQIPRWIPGTITADSGDLDWGGMTFRGYRYAGQQASIPAMRDYMIVAYRAGRSAMRRGVQSSWDSNYVEPGRVSLLTRAEPSLWEWQDPIDVQHVYLTQAAVERVLSEISDRDLLSAEIVDTVSAPDTALSATVLCLERELAEGGLGGRLYVDCIRTQIALHILRHYARIVPSGSIQGALSRAQRRLVTDFIEANLSSPFTLDELAAEIGLSVFSFSRRFRTDFATTPHAYVVARRVERARRLLRSTDLPLKAIAADCGFSDQSHLTRTIRKHLGATPGSIQRGLDARSELKCK